MITKHLATTLPRGIILHHTTRTNADLTPLRAHINGKAKTWVTRPQEFRLPMKHGLKDYFYITQDNADQWTLPYLSN